MDMLFWSYDWYTLEFQIYYIATTYSIAFYLFLDDETRFSVNS